MAQHPRYGKHGSNAAGCCCVRELCALLSFTCEWCVCTYVHRALCPTLAVSRVGLKRLMGRQHIGPARLSALGYTWVLTLTPPPSARPSLQAGRTGTVGVGRLLCCQSSLCSGCCRTGFGCWCLSLPVLTGRRSVLSWAVLSRRTRWLSLILG